MVEKENSRNGLVVMDEENNRNVVVVVVVLLRYSRSFVAVETKISVLK